MSVQAASLVAEVKVTDDAEAKSKLESVSRKVDQTASGFKDMLKGALSFAAGQAIFTGVGDAIGFLKDQLVDTVKAAMDHQQIEAQTVQALRSTRDASGETAQALQDLAEHYSGLTQYSEDSIQSTENLELTFTNISKKVFPQATQAILDVSQAMGQDLKSSAIQVGKALGDPLTGMTALQRIGVTFSATEKEEVKTMMAHNNVIGAQKIILHELSTEFGGSATAAGKTFSGQVAILKNQFEDLKIKVGTAVLPILGQFMTLVGTYGMPILTRLSDWFMKYIIPDLRTLSPLLKEVGGAFHTLFTPIQQIAVATLPAVADDFDRVSTVFGKVHDAGKPLLDTFDRATSYIKDATHAAHPLVDTFDRAKGTFDRLNPTVKQLNDQANPLLGIFKQLSPLVGDLIGFVRSIAGDIEDFATNTADAFNQSGALQSVLQLIHDILPDVEQFFHNLSDTLSTKVIPPVLKLISNFSTWLDKSGFLKDALHFLSDTAETLGNWLGTLVGWLSDLFGWLDQNKPAAYALKDAFFAIGGVIAGIKILQFGKDVYSTLKDATGHVKEFIGTLGKIKDKLGEVKDFFTGQFKRDSEGALKDVGKESENAGKSVETIGTDADLTKTKVVTDSEEMGGALGTDIEAGSVKADAGIEGIAVVGAETEAKVDAEAAGMEGALSGVLSMLQGVSLMGINLGEGSVQNMSPDQWAKEAGVSKDVFDSWSRDKQMQYIESWDKAHPGQMFPTWNQGLAGGTDFWQGGPTWVGEEGPELLYVPRGAQVFPHDQSMQMASGRSGGGYSGPQVVQVNLDSYRLISILMPMIADHKRLSLGGRI